MALGLTQQLPLDDRYTYSKDYLEAQLSVLMAGRVAENIFLDQTTTGAANDFEKATEIARKMVCQWGMSDLGPADVRRARRPHLPRPRPGRAQELQREDGRADRRRSQEDHPPELRADPRSSSKRTGSKLKKIAKLLLEKEVISSDEINAIAKVRKPKAPRAEAPTAKVPRRPHPPAPAVRRRPRRPEPVKG